MNVFIGYGYTLTTEDLHRIFPQLYTAKQNDDDDDADNVDTMFVDKVLSHLKNTYKMELHFSSNKPNNILAMYVGSEDVESGIQLFIGYGLSAQEFSYGTVVTRLSELNYNKQKEQLYQFVTNHPEFDDDQIQDDLCVLSSEN